jgi:hypothetical protein
MSIGKIVKSDSHINYTCQVYGPHEVDTQPGPTEYAFGRFVRIALRTRISDESHLDERQEITTYLVGVIYDTQLLNPSFSTPGPRLSHEAQVELFSPDYLSEKAILISILVLGMLEQHRTSNDSSEVIIVRQGVPLLSLELGSEVEAMADEDVQAFHFFSEPHTGEAPSLHIGYLPHVIAQRNSLMPQVTLRMLDQLERLFPRQRSLLSIIKRNFSWRLKVETTG